MQFDDFPQMKDDRPEGVQVLADQVRFKGNADYLHPGRIPLPGIPHGKGEVFVRTGEKREASAL